MGGYLRSGVPRPPRESVSHRARTRTAARRRHAHPRRLRTPHRHRSRLRPCHPHRRRPQKRLGPRSHPRRPLRPRSQARRQISFPRSARRRKRCHATFRASFSSRPLRNHPRNRPAHFFFRRRRAPLHSFHLLRRHQSRARNSSRRSRPLSLRRPLLRHRRPPQRRQQVDRLRQRRRAHDFRLAPQNRRPPLHTSPSHARHAHPVRRPRRRFHFPRRQRQSRNHPGRRKRSAHPASRTRHHKPG